MVAILRRKKCVIKYFEDVFDYKPLPTKYIYKRIRPIRKAYIDHKLIETDVNLYISHYIKRIRDLVPSLTINDGDDIFYFTQMEVTNISLLKQLDSIKTPYIALMIGYFDHISIMLVDKYYKCIEYFDTSYKQKYRNQLKEICDIYFPDYLFICVNDNLYIQKSYYDVYCQTWIFYYLYQRLYKCISHRIIMDTLNMVNDNERVDIIRNFFHEFIE